MKTSCHYLMKLRPDIDIRRQPCGKGGRACVVMGKTTEVRMDLCARHRRILGRDHLVYTVEAFEALQPRKNQPSRNQPVPLKLTGKEDSDAPRNSKHDRSHTAVAAVPAPHVEVKA